MQPQIKNTRERILVILEEVDEVQGTERLSGMLSLLNNKSYVIKSATRLLEQGEITVCRSCGGRGRKTVYKRNRNDMGLARKTR